MRFTVNPDKEHVAKIREGLKKNGNHCPCSIIIDDDHLCPCKEAREDGICHCNLYIITKD